MWFRNSKGQMICINRSDYITNKEYNQAICKKLFDTTFPKSENVLDKIKSIIVN